MCIRDRLRTQRSDGLHGHTLVIQVADDSTVAIVQSDVGQRAQLMPVVGACLPPGQGCCLHTLRQEWFGQGLFGSILVSGGGGLAVTGLVRGRAGRLKSRLRELASHPAGFRVPIVPTPARPSPLQDDHRGIGNGNPDTRSLNRQARPGADKKPHPLTVLVVPPVVRDMKQDF